MKAIAWIKTIQKLVRVDTIDLRSGTITYSRIKGVNTPCYQGDYILVVQEESVMSYYELPEHCSSCRIEINTGGWRDTGLCSYCWRLRKYKEIHEQSETA